MVIGGAVVGTGAVAVGSVALTRVRRGAAQGQGMAIAGVVTGIIGVFVSIAAVVAFLTLDA